MDAITLRNFQNLVEERTGLQIRSQELDGLAAVIDERMGALKLNPHGYYDLLNARSADTDQEWEVVIPRLTIGESYFFRDSGQFNLLRQTLLPALINSRRQTGQLVLRLWSAGCSTGEEPYSLAMLLDEILPDRESWDLLILGTDINKDSLAAAKQGNYSAWSFRLMKEELRDRYFQKQGADWELDPRIRSMVTFRHCNLIDDRFPISGTDFDSMDLIICRNVFIYFDTPTVGQVVKKMAETLHDGGYLMSGHGELFDAVPSTLKPRTFPESLTYKKKVGPGDASGSPAPVRGGRGEAGSAAAGESTLERFRRELREKNIPEGLPPVAAAPKTPVKPVQTVPLSKEPPARTKPEPEPLQQASPEHGDASAVNKLLLAAEESFRRGSYDDAITQAGEVLAGQADHFGALYLQAMAHANRGDAERALRLSNEALRVDPFAVKPHYLLARLAQGRGDLGEEKRLLQRIIYLDPACISAYLEIAGLYRDEGDAARAAKMTATALDILKSLSPESEIDNYEGVTAGELIGQIEESRK